MEFATATRVLIDTVDPTSTTVSYVYENKTIIISIYTWWTNSTLENLWMCMSNDGVTAVWKQVTLT